MDLLRMCLAALAIALVAGQQHRVAIVGGGVGGASAAHYLKQHMMSAVDIHVFERNHLGGRAEELEYEGLTLEQGASIIWHKNYLLRDLAAAGGLTLEALGGDGLLAVYDGKELVFKESQYWLLTLIRLIWRYWLSWWTLRLAPSNAFDKFEEIYTLLDKGVAFERPDHLLQAVGLYDLTQASLFEWVRENYGTSADLVTEELIGGVTHANYGQTNVEVNALAGLVSLLPATDPQVLRVVGGNGRLAPAVLAAANATVHCPATVTAVRRRADGRYEVVLQSSNGGGAAVQAPEQQQGQALAELQEQPFDAVIIATPLEGSGISLEGVDPPFIPARKYQQTVATFIKGRVRPSYLGLPPQPELPYSAVLVAEGAGVPWSSLGLVGRTASDNATVWKLFSRAVLPHAWLEMMFEKDYEVVAVRAWDAPGAYPAFDPPEDFAPFALAEGLFYTAALENAASAMEIAAIEGRMTALLSSQHLAEVRVERQPSTVDGADVLVHGDGGAEQNGGAAAAA